MSNFESGSNHAGIPAERKKHDGVIKALAGNPMIRAAVATTLLYGGYTKAAENNCRRFPSYHTEKVTVGSGCGCQADPSTKDVKVMDSGYGSICDDSYPDTGADSDADTDADADTDTDTDADVDTDTDADTDTDSGRATGETAHTGTIIIGSTGETGGTGETGKGGETGGTGADTSVGGTGSIFDSGKTTGNTGETGGTGDTNGVMGHTGETGATGGTGAQGGTGNTGLDTADTGGGIIPGGTGGTAETGTTGDTGISGGTGNTGLVIPPHTGDTGTGETGITVLHTGETGVQGGTGNTGFETGDTGLIIQPHTGGTGGTAETGTTGDTSISGGTGNTGLVIPPHTGDTGTGETGITVLHTGDTGGLVETGITIIETGDTALHTGDTGSVDSDGDGLSDALEASIGSNPNDPDSDGDGATDGCDYLEADVLNAAMSPVRPIRFTGDAATNLVMVNSNGTSNVSYSVFGVDRIVNLGADDHLFSDIETPIGTDARIGFDWDRTCYPNLTVYDCWRNSDITTHVQAQDTLLDVEAGTFNNGCNATPLTLTEGGFVIPDDTYSWTSVGTNNTATSVYWRVVAGY